MTDRDEARTGDAPESDDSPGADDEGQDADTFSVGIHVTETELRFVVNVPSDIDSGWTNPEAFQRLVERVTWETLDQETVLRTIASEAPEGETVFLGSVTLRSDETLVDHSLRPPSFDDA